MSTAHKNLIVRGLSRRQVLRGAGGVCLALPFLEALAPRLGSASSGPKRLVVVVHRQGTILNRWLPTGGELDFVLPDLLAPLAPWQDRITVVAGLDNKIPSYNSAGNGHINAELSLLTGQVFQNQSAAVLTPAGPSFEDAIAHHLWQGQSYRRLDFSVGGSGSGFTTSGHFWLGPDDPVVCFTDPQVAFGRLFSDKTLSPEEAAALSNKRGSVLDAVLEQFGSMMGRLGAEDRARLEAHADKVRELEQRVTAAASGACAAPQLSLPADYAFTVDDDVSFEAQSDLLLQALACDQTRVGTLHFANGDSPTFPWLSVGGQPVVDTTAYDNWHAMVHSGREEEGLFVGLRWYSSCFARLLEKMAAGVDVDGDSLLDTTCILWISEFGNGTGHNTLKIPAVLAGHRGGASQGRFLNYMSGGPDDDWTASEFTTNQLFVSLQNLFGLGSMSFGHVDDALPLGPLEGL